MTKSPIYDIIEDTVIESLEGGPWLPLRFSVVIDNIAFRAFANTLKVSSTGLRIPVTQMRLTVNIQGHTILVRSDKDPDPWMPMLHSETLN